jgi:hypothetical protein
LNGCNRTRRPARHVALTLLSLTLLGGALPAGSRPRRPTANRPVLVGYVSPHRTATEPATVELWGKWSRGRGWVLPDDEPIGPGWRATRWQLFSRPDGEPRIVTTRPLPEAGEGGEGGWYSLRTPAPAGVAVSGAARPRLRRAQRQAASRPELLAATRELLREAGIRPPGRPRLIEAWRVDLDGDGKDEVLWTARSRAQWRSPYLKPGDPTSPRLGDYALLALRYLAGGRVRSVALAREVERLPKGSPGANPTAFHPFCPLDLDGDGRMEILARAEAWEEEALLIFGFDGRQVKGLLGTTFPPKQGSHWGE